MPEAYISAVANRLGAIAITLSDAIVEATERATGMAGGPPAALVSLHEWADGRSVEVLAAAMRDEGRRRILLVDAPAVLGRAVLDEIDARHGLQTLVCGLRDAMDAGAIKRLPVEPLAQLFGALFDRAALAPVERQGEFQQAMAAMVEGLRASPGERSARSAG